MNGSSQDLARVRHDLRTPINHILGYCEMLLEEEELPPAFATDLRRVHEGGRQLLRLIGEYFDETVMDRQPLDLSRLYHDLRTPVNHIIGYSEMIGESAEEAGLARWIPDLQRIGQAARTWLALMEEYLLPLVARATEPAAGGEPPSPLDHASLLAPGVNYQTPSPRTTVVRAARAGAILMADDDKANREILARRLRRQGHTVIEAETGLQALQLMRAHAPDLVLLDLIMPELDGYQILVKMKSDPALRHIPVIMISGLDQENGIARCIEAGAQDYLTKPFNSVFLRARIGACLEQKRLRDQEQATHLALVKSQKRLAAELAEAAAYVRSLLPEPLSGAVRTDWRFLPSTELGGDVLGSHWLDDDHFAFFLVDVSGHGLSAAFLSISILNVLRSQSLPATDFKDPAAVLGCLNVQFPMDRHHNLLFTAWYGVYCRSEHRLIFSSGGHPPAVMISPPEGPSAAPQRLRTPGMILGFDPGSRYQNEQCLAPPGSRLFLYSDGAYEIAKPDGGTAKLEDFISQLATPGRPGLSKLDELIAWARNLHGEGAFDDDLSILMVEF